MSEKLKQIDKRFLIIVGAIFGILIIIVVVAMVLAGRSLSPEKLEEKLVDAAKDYLADGEVEKPAEGKSITITDSELISKEYIKEMSEYNDENCSGYVTVFNNNGLSNYVPNLKCDEYATVQLGSKVIEDQLVEEEVVDGTYQFGLYKVEDEYIFKGSSVNNYVKFGGVTWRIIKIDSNGNLRLIKTPAEEEQIAWDTKYNNDTKDTTGINDYANSTLYTTLLSNYKGFNDDNKRHLVAHDVCIGSRGKKDVAISYEYDCATLLEGQYISTLTTLDVPMASLDPNCINVTSASCTNYNYMKGISAWTVNSYAETSHEAFYVSGIVRKNTTEQIRKYYWVVYVSGQEVYKGGSGTAEDPYIIK